MFAIIKSNIRLIKKLIKAGADVNLKDKTALIKASEKTKLEIMKLLIERK